MKPINHSQQPVREPETVPLERFLEVNAQLRQAQQELNRLQAGQSSNPNDEQAPPSLEELSAEEAVQLLSANPVGFIQQVVDQSARNHLSDLKEEAELNGALKAIRREKPEFQRFEPFILQEVAALLEEDEDGVIDPWQDLLEKGYERFREKFRETLEKNPDLLVQGAPDEGVDKKEPASAYLEGQATRKMPKPPARFSRDQIARMSIEEFLANESAINEALKNNRIR